MNVAVLNVEGDNEALARVREAMPSEPGPYRSWQEGDESRPGKRKERSGFSVELVDAENPGAMMALVLEYFSTCHATGVNFRAAGVTAELSIGFTVGNSQQFAAGVDIDADSMGVLSALGVDFGLMAYPTSDEANTDESAIQQIVAADV